MAGSHEIHTEEGLKRRGHTAIESVSSLCERIEVNVCPLTPEPLRGGDLKRQAETRMLSCQRLQ